MRIAIFVLLMIVVVGASGQNAGPYITTMSEAQIAEMRKDGMFPADPDCAAKYPKNSRAFDSNFDEHGFIVFGDDTTNEIMECWVSSPRSHLTNSERRLWLALWREHQIAQYEAAREAEKTKVITHNHQTMRCFPIDTN